MRTVGTITGAAMVAILAILALGAGAVAAPEKTRLIIVNGYAGKKIDVCVNGNEKRSGLRYGGKTVQLVGLGTKKLKFYQSNASKCGGKLLAKWKLPALTEPGDLTVVLTKKFPNKVQVFDNGPINAATEPGQVQFFWRDAADIGTVSFSAEFIDSRPVDPEAGDSVWQKGDEASGIEATSAEVKVIVTRPGKARRLAKTPFRSYELGQHREAILVGDKLRNAKFVEFVVSTRAEATP